MSEGNGNGSEAPVQADYLSRFCPILTHGIVAAQSAIANAPSSLIAPGAASLAPAPPAAPEREFIGCQGPNCAFFVRNEGMCGVPLISMGLGAMLSMVRSAPPTPSPSAPKT